MNTNKLSKTSFQVRSFLFYWLPTFIWIAVICYLSLADSGVSKIKFRFIFESDKIAHIGLYFVLILLLIRSWNHLFTLLIPGYLLLFSATQSIIFGILMEILQKQLTSTRVFDLNDIYANIGGAIAGVIVYLLYNRFFSGTLSNNTD